MARDAVWSQPPNGASSSDPTLRRRRRWALWGGIVWVAVTPLSLGLLAAFAFSFAAAKRRSLLTVITAVVCAAVLVGLFLTAEDEESVVFDVLFFGNLVLATSAAIMLRPHVFPVPKAPAPQAAVPTPAPMPPPTVSTPMPAPRPMAPPTTNAHLVDAAAQRQAHRAEARALARQDPTTAIELGIGRPDRTTGYDDGGLIDLNRAPEAVLARLPGLQPHQARALAQTRGELGPFVSVADAMIRADIPPHLESELAEYAVVF